MKLADLAARSPGPRLAKALQLLILVAGGVSLGAVWRFLSTGSPVDPGRIVAAVLFLAGFWLATLGPYALVDRLVARGGYSPRAQQWLRLGVALPVVALAWLGFYRLASWALAPGT